mgnify:CR=1 FL=1
MRHSTWEGDGYGSIEDDGPSEVFALRREIKKLQEKIKELETQLLGKLDGVSR